MAKFDIKKIFNALKFDPQIGGLEISDTHLRYVVIKSGKADFANIKIPPGIIIDGKIKDKDQFVGLLLSFRQQIKKGKNDKLFVVVNISDNNVYTELFSLPKSSLGNIEEAVNLNLQMISPIDFATSYSDWHMVGEKIENNASSIEIMGSFVSKAIIDEFEYVLKQAGFEIIAIEFSTLALIRTITELEENFDKTKNYLVFKVGSDGFSFGLIKNSNLYFLHFVSWVSLYGEQRSVSLESLRKIVVEEIQKVLGFYESRWGEKIDKIFVLSATLTEEIFKIVLNSYPDLSPQVPTIKVFKNLSFAWLSVLGSAIRGSMPREKDIIISLASVGTEKKYKQQQILNFIKNWRNIILAYLGAVLVILIGLDLFLINQSKSFDLKKQSFNVNPNYSKITELKKQADDFNKKVDTIIKLQKTRSKMNELYSLIIGVAGNDVNINRLIIPNTSSPVSLIGEAATDKKIIDFKKRLESNPRFSNIVFDVSSIFQSSNDKLGFTITFNVK